MSTSPEMQRAFLFYVLAVNWLTMGHCEDRRLHHLLPYEMILYCDCGARLELDEADALEAQQFISARSAETPRSPGVGNSVPQTACLSEQGGSTADVGSSSDGADG